MSIRVMTIVWEHYPEGGSKLITMLAMADWGDDTGDRCHDIGRVEPPAQTDLEQCQVHTRPAKPGQRDRGGGLEEGRWVP